MELIILHAKLLDTVNKLFFQLAIVHIYSVEWQLSSKKLSSNS